MIKKEDLKDWLAEGDRKESMEKIEKEFDERIKSAALFGKTSFNFSTGRVNNAARRHEKTPFYNVWHDPKLSRENQKIVQKNIIQKYKDFGFDVEVVQFDHGWDSRYDGIQFNNIDKLINGVSK